MCAPPMGGNNVVSIFSGHSGIYPIVDLINQIEGVSFDEAWKNKKVETLKIKSEEMPIYIIGLEQLIQNKRMMKRYKDLDDLQFLD